MQTASTAERITAQWRSFFALAQRSKTVDQTKLRFAKLSSDLQLEKRILTTPPGLKALGFRLDMTLEEKRNALDVPAPVSLPPCDDQRNLSDFCRTASDMRQTSNWKFRIGAHAELLHHLGWYPFFVTLTLDPSRMAPWAYDTAAFWKHGKEWQRFRRDVVELVARTMGHSVRVARSNPNYYLQYCGVLEHGKSRHHHHMHCLLWLREIPANWKVCPNRNNPAKNYLECLPFKKIWKWGRNTKFCYFRYQNDIWRMRHNFVAPSKPNGRKMNFLDVTRAGTYLAKYMKKECKEWSHRMKCSRNLGLTTLRTMLRNLPMAILNQAARRLTRFSDNLNWKNRTATPHNLMRQYARREIFFRQWISRSRLTGLLDEKPKPFSDMLNSVKSGHKPWLMPSPERFAWLQSVLPPETIAFCDRSFEDLLQITSELSPPTSSVPIPQISGI